MGAGLGTWAAGQATDSAEVEATIEVGVRLIDTATVYFNEAAIGKVLKKWMDAGKVKRQDLFIVTKLPIFGLDPSMVRPTVEKALRTYASTTLISISSTMQWVLSLTTRRELRNRMLRAST